MFKKILFILLCLLLVSCSNNNPNHEVIEEDVFIEPINDIVIFDELDGQTKQDLRLSNGNKAFKNYQFKVLNKDIYKGNIIDINGHIINFKDYPNLIFEVVSTECEHCKDFISNYLDQLLAYDIPVVQYFNIGDKNEIKQMYDDLGIGIPSNLMIVEYNKELYDYVRYDLGLESYPTLVCFKNNRVSLDVYGDTNKVSLDKLIDLAFNNTITIDPNIISLDRTAEDVKNSLSKENLSKLEHLDNDQYTLDLTCKLIGNKVDYETISNIDSEVFINEIEDYSSYKDNDLIVIYTCLKKESQEDVINNVNDLITSNSDYSYLVVLVEGLDNSSSLYRKMNTKFMCPVTSMSSALPDDLMKFGIAGYPTAVFIKKGYFVGAYSKIKSVDLFNEAIDTFMSQDSVALKANN